MKGTATCDACTPTTTAYEWKIFKKISSNNWEELTDVDNMLSTNRLGQMLAVRAHTLLGGETYKFRLESWVPPAATRGYSEYIKEVNRPPHEGRCDVKSIHTETPLLGYAFQQDFTIKCQGWKDDTKLIYSVTVEVDAAQPEIMVPADAVLDVNQEYTSSLLTLPVGKKENEYWIRLFIKIKDEDEASIRFELKAQVMR